MSEWIDDYPEQSEGWWSEDRRVEEAYELLSSKAPEEVLDVYRRLTIVGRLQPFFGPRLLFDLAFAKLKVSSPKLHHAVLMQGAREDDVHVREECIKALHDKLLTEPDPEAEELMVRLLSHEGLDVREDALRTLHVTLHRVPRSFERVLELTRQMLPTAASVRHLN